MTQPSHGQLAFDVEQALGDRVENPEPKRSVHQGLFPSIVTQSTRGVLRDRGLSGGSSRGYSIRGRGDATGQFTVASSVDWLKEDLLGQFV